MNRVMLRFRPIAPKPASGAAEVVDRSNDAAAVVKRTKRKYVRVRGRQSKQQQCSSINRKIVDGDKSSPPPPPEKSGTESETSSEKVTVTLQLLPERSERDYNNFKICDNSSTHVVEDDNTDKYKKNDVVRSVTETMVVVERVTDTCLDDSAGTAGLSGVGLGFSEKEKIKSLEEDTCPAFISDGRHNVLWVNEAYKRMVGVDETASEKGFMVWLVVKDELPRFCPSFACRVRVIQHKGQGQKWNRIVPCDVWRMDFCGGFAWKLDVNTALGLSVQA